MRGYVDTRWGQVHFRHAGDAGPTIVFFHESPLSSVIYDPALPYLGRSFRAYAFDTPGFGQSDPPPQPPSVEEYSATLLEAIDNLGIERLVVAGCHTGAALALDVARQAGPERVSHVVLTGVTLMKPHEWEPWLAHRVFGEGRTVDPTRTAKEIFAPDFELRRDGSHLGWAWTRTAVGRKDWPPDSPLELVNRAVMQLLIAGRTYNWGYRAVWDYDAEPALRALACPVLMLNAAEDPLAHLDEPVAQLLQNGRVVHVEGLAGQLPSRVPEQFADEIAQFVGVDAVSD